MGDESSFSVNGPDSFTGAMVMVLVGLAVTGYGAYDYVQQSDAIENAVEVDATVTEVGIESNTAGSSTDIEYQPTISFTYSYEGTSYTGTDVFPAELGKTYERKSDARAVVSDYEEGETVTAYVSPSEPDDAFLKTQKSNMPLLVTGGGLFFVFVGGWSAVNQH